jgi:RNA polymerase sigma factor (sigma-70 family)
MTLRGSPLLRPVAVRRKAPHFPGGQAERIRSRAAVTELPGSVREHHLHLWGGNRPCPGVVQDVVVTAETELELVYREEGARLWRGVLAYCGDREVANDAVAETFAQALARGPGIREPRLWVWRTAFRIASGELKARRSRFGSSVTDAAYELSDEPTEIAHALSRLSPKQRAALVLHYYADRPTKQIASILGMSAATVRVHLSQGRKRLRSILEERSDA